MGDETRAMGRRELLAGLAAVGVVGCGGSREDGPMTPTAAPAPSPSAPARVQDRVLGRTGVAVEAVSLGGEGILRTHGAAAAVPMLHAAFRAGVRYCDTAPAYAGSQDYYGEAFRTMPGARDRVFLATKTHARDRDGALRLLDDSLRRLGTDRVDLWQMHDLRDEDELDVIFGRGGAIEAAQRARDDGRIRFVGLTGHQHPGILVEAMRRFDFDTVLLPINPADRRHLPFLATVVPAARERRMGVIGMKVMAAGRLLQDGTATPEECIRYGAAFADTVIIGCSSAAEVEQNLRIGRSLPAYTPAEQREIEARIAPVASRYDTFKV